MSQTYKDRLNNPIILALDKAGKDGVRPKWDLDHGTHMYVMTPREVMDRGATKFVIGNTIRNAKDKNKAIQRILKEIRN